MSDAQTRAGFLAALESLPAHSGLVVPPCAAVLARDSERVAFKLTEPCAGKVEPHHFEVGTPSIWTCAHHWSVLGHSGKPKPGAAHDP